MDLLTWRGWRLGLIAACACLAAVDAGSQTVTRLTLRTNDLAYVPQTGRIYASVPSSAGAYGNRIVAIDPVTGSVTASLYVGSEPDRLAASDDGSTLYVGLDGAGAVRLVRLDTFTAGLQFSLSNWNCYSSIPYVGDIAVQPGNAGVIAVAHACSGSSGGEGIAIYDGGVRRTAVASDWYDYGSITFGASASILYAYDNSTTAGTFSRLRVDASGVAKIDGVRDLFSYFREGIRYAGGRVYASGGEFVDPGLPAPVGVIPGGAISLTVDAARGLAIVLQSHPSNSSSKLLAAFDTTTFLQRWSVEVPNVGSSYSLVQAGTNEVAFRTENQVVLVEVSAVAGMPHYRLRLDKQGTGTGVVGASAGNLACGTACQAEFPSGTAVTLTATADAGSVFAGWSGSDDCTDGAVTMAGPTTCTAAFTQVSQGPAVRRVALRAGHLLYDPATRLLYVSLAGSNGAIGNSVTTIDPLSGTLGAPLWVGSEPSQLAMSDDGQYLYVGLNGAVSAARVNLTAKALDRTFSLGPDFYYRNVTAVRVQPGHPDVIVVSRGSSSGYTAAYADGVKRPGVLEWYQASPDIDFGATPDVLYTRAYAGSSLITAGLDATGLHIQKTATVSMSGPIEFEGGLVYGGGGEIVDPGPGATVGRLAVGQAYGLAIDGASNEAVALKAKDSRTATLTVFDLARFVPLWSVDISLNGSSSWTMKSVVRWGTTGFAFLTDDAIFLVDAQAAATATHRLRIDKLGTGGGTVTASATGVAVGIACGVACSADIPAGTPVMLTAVADAGSTFAGWTGAEDCLDGEVTMTNPRTCTAVFNRTQTPGPLTRRIALPANDLAYDPVAGRLYASLPSSLGAAGNSVVSIDPATGQVGTPIWVGSEPSKLALSSDGTALYVATNGSTSVTRLRPLAGSTDLRFRLPAVPTQMRVQPGNFDVLVASHGSSAPLTAYSGGVQLTGTVGSVSSFDFSGDPTVLFGANYDDLLRMTLSPSGVQLAQRIESVLPSYDTLEYEGGRIYLPGGAVINSQDGTRWGTFTGPTYLSLVAPDAATATAFFLNENRNNSSVRTLAAYDMATFVPRWSVDIPIVASGSVSPRSLVRWGATGVAFLTADAIVIADYAGFQTSALLTIVKAGLGVGTVSSSSGIDCGPTCLSQVPIGETVALTVAPTPPGAFWGWSGDADCADGVVTMSGPVTCVATFTTDRLQFTDEPLVPGSTTVRAVHITELRQRVDDVRARYGLAPISWTDATIVRGVTTIKAVHLAELRTALAQAYAIAGRPAPWYSTPAVVAGQTIIGAAQIEELRAAIAAIW